MFTVKQLSKIVGVTPRTLHYYDEIGLLKPTRVGANGYRYYGEETLLRMQQIMLYRRLDIPLDQIKSILEQPDFNAITALEAHIREIDRLIGQLERIKSTVEYTILLLKGVNNMDEVQLFDGFSEEQQAEYEKEAMQRYDPDVVKTSNQKWKGYSPEKKQQIFSDANTIYRDFCRAMEAGAASSMAQDCVSRWRENMNNFWSPDDGQLLALVDGYNDDLRFKANFDKIDPRLAEFIRECVKIYVAIDEGNQSR